MQRKKFNNFPVMWQNIKNYGLYWGERIDLL